MYNIFKYIIICIISLLFIMYVAPIFFADNTQAIFIGILVLTLFFAMVAQWFFKFLQIKGE